MSKIIYARVSDEVHQAVRETAQVTGKSAAGTVEALLRKALGLAPAPTLPTVDEAITARRGQAA